MKRRSLALTGLLIGMAVSALMQTFVSATAAGIAASLGGTALYPWIFSAYILASTVSMPLFGKLGESSSARFCSARDRSRRPWRLECRS
jgi:MFS family permease